MMDINVDLLQWFINFLIKKTPGSGFSNEIITNKELTEELHKPIIRKFKKRKVQSPFIDNIRGADLADMQLISKFDKGFGFLLCAIDIYGKYAWFIPLKDKKETTVTNAFQNIFKKSNLKPSKIWVDKDSKFCNRSMKSWLEKNDLEMHSTHNQGKSIVAWRSIKTLKNKIFKYMTSISKNVYIDKLDDTINEYNNTYHNSIKMKPVDVKTNKYFDSSREINDKDPKFKVDDIVRISKYKTFLQKSMFQIGLKEFLWLKKLKTPCRGHVIIDLKGKEIVRMFYKKELQKMNQKEFRVKKIIKRKGHKLYVKWKCYSSSFNSWIEKNTQYK